MFNFCPIEGLPYLCRLKYFFDTQWQILYFEWHYIIGARKQRILYLDDISQELFDKLSSQNWEDILPKLTHYAAFLAKSLNWLRGSADLPKGLQPQDLVHEAITLVYTGKRHWDPDKVPDISVFLKGVIRSLVSHLVQSPEHTRRQNLELEGGEGEPTTQIEIADAKNPDALELSIVRDVGEYLWNHAGDDEDMKLVLLCLDEEMKRGDIANQLDFPLKKVDNILKRIRRATIKYFESK